MQEPDRARHVRVNRTSLRVWEWGPTWGPAIICAHGAYDHGRMFDGIAPMLAEDGFRVLCLDMRGHGDSGPIDTGHTFEASVLDIGALASSFSEPVGFLGHSMGSGMLMSAAATWPELARWVISLDGLGPPAAGFEGQTMEEEVVGSWTSLVKALGRSRRVFASTDAMAEQRATINTRVPAAWIEHLVRHGARPDGDGWSWKWDPLFNTYLPDGFNPEWVTGDFEAIDCPVLAIMGGADDMWSFPSEEIEDRAGHLRDVRIVSVPDAGHYVHLEQPDHVIAHIRTFLGELDR